MEDGYPVRGAAAFGGLTASACASLDGGQVEGKQHVSSDGCKLAFTGGHEAKDSGAGSG